MITFRRVTADDMLLNRKIEELNNKVFPYTETADNLHYLAGLYEGAKADFVAMEDDGPFIGYAYVINFFQGSFIYYLAIEPAFQDKGYGTALLNYIREMQGHRPIALTVFTPLADNEDYEECLRRKWFYIKNGYIDQRIPYPCEDYHRYDVMMNGSDMGYTELIAMLDKVSTLFNELYNKESSNRTIEKADRFVDEFGAIYSRDGKRLIKGPNVKNYKIREGTESVDELAFVDCDKLECLYFPYTCPEEAIASLDINPETLGAISFWDEPYVPEELDTNNSWVDDEVYIDEHDVVYSMDRKRLLNIRVGFKGGYYIVPEGTITICDQAFIFHEKYLLLSVPSSIRIIGDNLFGRGGGKIIFRP